MSEVQLSVTESGGSTLVNMRQRVRDIEMEHGHFSSEYIKILESLLDNILNILRLGGRVSKDGELSLFVHSFIVYGVIFHSKYIDGENRDPLLGDWSCHS
jgi:hypothetical protein